MTITAQSVQGVAGTAEKVIEGVMGVEPYVATIAGAAIPGAAPIVAAVQPMVMVAIPFVENALKSLSAGNGGDSLTAFVQLLQHLMPGMPNAPILQAPAAPTAPEPQAS
jgi:hypothetical protein